MLRFGGIGALPAKSQRSTRSARSAPPRFETRWAFSRLPPWRPESARVAYRPGRGRDGDLRRDQPPRRAFRGCARHGRASPKSRVRLAGCRQRTRHRALCDHVWPDGGPARDGRDQCACRAAAQTLDEGLFLARRKHLCGAIRRSGRTRAGDCRDDLRLRLGAAREPAKATAAGLGQDADCGRAWNQTGHRQLILDYWASSHVTWTSVRSVSTPGSTGTAAASRLARIAKGIAAGIGDGDCVAISRTRPSLRPSPLTELLALRKTAR